MENAPQSTWVLERMVIEGSIRLREGVSTIGRNPSCTISVTSNYVSRNHAEFEVLPDRQFIQIRDLGSTNGIFINDVQVTNGSCNARVGDRIGIGVSVENADITQNHQIFVLKNIPVPENNSLLCQSDEDTDDFEVILPSPEVAKNKEDKNSEGIVIADSDYDDDDNEDDFVQPEDIDDNELENDILFSPVSVLKKGRSPKNNVVSENIKSIFGDLNPELLKNLPKGIREIAQPSGVSPTGQKPNSQDIVCILSSDDEVNDDRCETAKSPQLFADSFSEEPSKRNGKTGESLRAVVVVESQKLPEGPKATVGCQPSVSDMRGTIAPKPLEQLKPAEPAKASEQLKTSGLSKLSEQTKPSEKTNVSEGADPSVASTSHDPHICTEALKSLMIPKQEMCTDDEEEELIFTQMILDEAREVLSDSEHEDSPKFEVDEKGDFMLQPIKLEQSFSKKNDVISLDDDDDDEYDEALESKVNKWTLKLSQSFSNSFNCSQIYEDDVDSLRNIKTENIFIDDDNDLDEKKTVESDEASGEGLDTFWREDIGIDKNVELEPEKETNKEESQVIRHWKKSRSSKFLFSSSSSNEEENEDSSIVPRANKVIATSGDTKRSRKSSTTEEIPKKKTCLTAVGRKNDKEIHKSDKSSKESKENIASKRTAEDLFDNLKRTDVQTKEDDQSRDRRTDKRVKSSDGSRKLKRLTSSPNRRNSSNYMSAKFAKSISTNNQSLLEDFYNDFEELEAKNEAEKSTALPPAPEPEPEPEREPQLEHQSKPESSYSHSNQRRPPMIINPPQLPTHKGKLRGVSAVQHKTAEIIKDIQKQKDLKRKFLEKPSIAKRKAEQMSKDIREDRKQKLKELASKKTSEDEKVKENEAKKRERKHKDRPKVKVTPVNRGAFLTETSAAKPFKIPKKTSKPTPSTSSLNESSKVPNSTASSTTQAAPSSTTQAAQTKITKDGAADFNAELLKADDAIIHKSSTSNAFRERQKSVDVHAEQKQRAPPRRNSKKLTFEAMQQHFEETTRAKELQSRIGKNKPSSLKVQQSPGKTKKKKTVRFNDVPQIRYIEPVPHAVRKADKKESTTFNERRNFIRRRFPIVDLTDELLDDVLSWSHDWMQNKERCLNPDYTDQVIFPMTDKFTSIKQYKSIIFPLLKMEYYAHLERHLQKYAAQASFKITIDHFSQYKNRELIFARCSTRLQQSQLGNTDLALVNIHAVNSPLIQCLAYVTNVRKNEKWSIITLELMPKVIPQEKWKNASQITIKRVIEGLRVHFGSFNAVHQLSQTPLFQKILNPLELLTVKNNWHPAIEYKGCDPMNPEQKEILLKTYAKAIDESNPNISLIKGPPGTGKSRLITNLTLQLLYGNEIRQLDKKILVCAQSNMAVDVIARQLYHIQKKLSPRAAKYQVIRFGKEDRVSSDLLGITLSKLIQLDQRARLQNNFEANHAAVMSENLSQEIQKLEARIAALEKENHSDVRQDELIELRKNLSLKKSIHNQTLRPEDEKKLYPQYLENANVVCTTLSSCVKLSHYINYFDVCIIDEATQCIEPWTIMPLKFGVNSLVMVGDTQQLPATVLSQKAKEYGLGTSLFTRIQSCLENGDTNQPSPIFSLHTQYRMHPEICKWPNMYFYKNELLNSPLTTEFKSLMRPFSILNLDYRQNDECHNGQISNSLEAKFVAKLVKALDAYIPNKFFSYGIITPYAHHREKLESMIRSDGLTNIMVNTIDSYQGIEKDVIIISNARTQGVGFLSNYQRLNVALTRPKKCLILCGNFKNLQAVPSWASLLANARERGLYHDISTADALKIDGVIDKLKIKR